MRTAHTIPSIDGRIHVEFNTPGPNPSYASYAPTVPGAHTMGNDIRQWMTQGIAPKGAFTLRVTTAPDEDE